MLFKTYMYIYKTEGGEAKLEADLWDLSCISKTVYESLSLLTIWLPYEGLA